MIPPSSSSNAQQVTLSNKYIPKENTRASQLLMPALQKQSTRIEKVSAEVERPDGPSYDQPINSEKSVVVVKRKRETKEENSNKQSSKKQKDSGPINLDRSVIVKRKREVKEENPSELTEEGSSKKQKQEDNSLALVEAAKTEDMEFNLLNYPEEIICQIADKLDFKTLAALDQTCSSLRGIVDHTWGVFRRRDGLDFEFEIAEGRSNSDKYLLSYAVLEGLTKKYVNSRVQQKLLLKFESISRLLAVNSSGVMGQGLGSKLCPVYLDIKLAAEKLTKLYVGDSLLFAQTTPLEGHEDEILDHYTIALNHGISAVSSIAWRRFSSEIWGNGNIVPVVPDQLEHLVILGAHQGDYATLSLLLRAKPSVIEVESIQHYSPVLVIKAERAYKEGHIQEAIRLYEDVLATYTTEVPLYLLLDVAEICRKEVTSLKKAAELYELILTRLDFEADSIYFRAADVYTKLTNHKRAAEIFMIAAQKKNFHSLRNFINAAGEYAKVIDEYKVNNIPLPLDILQSAASANLNAEIFKVAYEYYSLCNKRHEEQNMPVPIEVLAGYAKANLKKKNYKVAKELYEKIICYNVKEAIPISSSLFEEAAESTYRQGTATKDKKLAESLFKRAVELYDLALDQYIIDKISNDQCGFETDSLIKAAKSNEKIGKLQRAAEICEYILSKTELVAATIPTLEITINVNNQLGNFKKSAECYVILLSRKGNRVKTELLKEAADVYYKAGNFMDAIKLYERIINKENAASLQLILKLAQSNFQVGLFLKSAQYYNSAVSLHLADLSLIELESAVIAFFKVNNLAKAAQFYEVLLQKCEAKNLPVPSGIFHYGTRLYSKINDSKRVMQLFDLYFNACNNEKTPIQVSEVHIAANINFTEQNFPRAAQLYEILIQEYSKSMNPVSRELLEKAYQSNFQINDLKKYVQFFELFFNACENEKILVPLEELKSAANVHYQEKNYPRAVELYKMLIERYQEQNISVPVEVLEKFELACMMINQ